MDGRVHDISNTQQAVVVSLFPDTLRRCLAKTSTGAQCDGTYRMEFRSLQFVGCMFFVMMQAKMEISNAILVGDLRLYLSGVCCKTRSHYRAYVATREDEDTMEQTWYMYDDLNPAGENQGTLKRCPKKNATPWEQGRGFVQVAVYVTSLAVGSPADINMAALREALEGVVGF